MEKSLKNMTPSERALHTVKLANKVINGSRSLDVLNEIFLYFVMKEINPLSENPLKIVTKKEDYALYRGLERSDHKYVARELKKIYKHFKDNDLIVEDEVEIEKNGKKKKVKRLIQRAWLTGLDLIGDDIIIGVSEEVGGYLMYKKDQPYTKVLFDISNFRKSYTVGIKELIEAELFKKKKSFIVPIEKVVFKLGVQKRYPNLYDLKKYVLNPARKELKDLNYPIQFDYEVLNVDKNILEKGKRGGKYIRFIIDDRREEIAPLITNSKKSTKPTLKQATVQEVIEAEHKQQYQNLYEQLTGWGIKETQTYELIKDYGVNKVIKAIEVVKTTPNVKNPSGLFMKALKENWENAGQKEQEKKRQERERIKARNEAQKRKEQQGEERKRTYRTQLKSICDSLLTEEKGIGYFHEKSKKYIAGIIMRNHLTIAPSDIYNGINGGIMTQSYMLYTIMQEYPQHFEKLNAEYPECVLSFDMVQ